MTFDQLALGICVVWSIRISLTDLQSYRISNLSLAFGAIFIWPALALLGQRLNTDLTFFIMAVISLTFALGNLFGMGDAKLLILLTPWLHRGHLIIPALIAVLIAWLQLLLNLAIHRQLPQRVALGPAILIASAINMAT